MSQSQPPRRIINPVQHDAATFVKTADETAGAASVLELEVAPGGGNVLHYHTTFAEQFTVVSGEFGVQVGKDTFTLKPGETAVAPARSVHRWFNTTPRPAIVRVELRPGSPGFERMLQILYGLAGDGLVDQKGLPKSLVHKALLANLSDTNIPGVLSVLAPLLRLIATRAKRQGVLRELEAQYCR